jgi:hypothetical protein
VKLVTPSQTVLRKLAELAVGSTDPDVSAWLTRLSRATRPKKLTPCDASVVATYRNHKLCGYEAWRHFAGDVKRSKARVWFGLRPMHEGGKEVPALERAQNMAAFLRSLSEDELRAWWANRHAEREAKTAAAGERERLWFAEKAKLGAKRKSERAQRVAEALSIRKERAAEKAVLRQQRAAEKVKRMAERAAKRAQRLAAKAERQRLRAGKVRGLTVQVHRGRVIAYVALRYVGGVAIRASFSVKKWTAKTGRASAAYEEAVKAVKWMQAETTAMLLEWRKKHTARRQKYRPHRSYSPVPCNAGGKLRGYGVRRFGCNFWFPIHALKKAEALSTRIGAMTKEQVFRRLARHRSSDRPVAPRLGPLGVVGYDVRVRPVHMYFDKAEWRSQSGHDGAAREVAGKVARRLKGMTAEQLHQIWLRYQRIASRHKAVETPDHGVAMDFESLAQMSHVFRVS